MNGEELLCATAQAIETAVNSPDPLTRSVDSG
jgi:hypothetical protein